MRDRDPRLLVVLSDRLSARGFFDGGFMSLLDERFGEGLRVRFLSDDWIESKWVSNICRGRIISDSEYNAQAETLPDRWFGRFDEFLDDRIGWIPLAIRFNLEKGFHPERMKSGHSNAYLNLDRIGPLPNTGWSYRMMYRWLFSGWRYSGNRIGKLLDDVDCLVVSNLQQSRVVPFLVGARERGIPVVGNIASWDHPVGKGVIYRECERYLVQNEMMREQLVLYHGVDPGRIDVTGWPHVDCLSRPIEGESYRSILSELGIRAERPVVLVAGNTPTNNPYEPRFLDRLLQWRRDAGLTGRFSILFRPHPRDFEWKSRFERIGDEPDFAFQYGGHGDIDVLAMLLHHVDCVVCNAGTVLLDAMVCDRPSVCVLYDEIDTASEEWARLNTVGEHYRAMMGAGAFPVAESFEQVCLGIRECLQHPAKRRDARRRLVQALVGKLDGRTASRMAEVVADVVGSGSRVAEAAGKPSRQYRREVSRDAVR